MRNMHTEATNERMTVSIDFFFFIAERIWLTCKIEEDQIRNKEIDPICNRRFLQIFNNVMHRHFLRGGSEKYAAYKITFLSSILELADVNKHL